MFKKWSIAFGLGVAVSTLGITLGSTASADDMQGPFATDAFIGTWTFQSGSQVTSPCLSTPIDLNAAQATIAAGSTSGTLVATVQGCQIPFTESDASNAKLTKSTSCTLTDPSSGTSYAVNVTSGNLSLSGGVLTVSGAGTAEIFCSVSLTGTATQ